MNDESLSIRSFAFNDKVIKCEDFHSLTSYFPVNRTVVEEERKIFVVKNFSNHFALLYFRFCFVQIILYYAFFPEESYHVFV